MGLKTVELIFLSFHFCLLFFQQSTFIFVEGKDESGKGSLKAEIRHDSKLNVTRIEMDFEASIHLFRQWQDQAVSGLMAAIASKKISKVSREDAIAHERCAKSADSVLKHAQCVSELLQKPQAQIQEPPDRDTRTLFSRLKPHKIHQPAKPLERFSKTPTKNLQRQKTPTLFSTQKSKRKSFKGRFEKLSKRNRKNKKFQPVNLNIINPIQQSNDATSQKWRAKSIIKKIGAFKVVKSRRKRYILKSATNYQLKDANANMTPLGIIAKQLTQRILHIKNKSFASSWQSIIAKAHKTADKKRQLKKARQHFPKDSVENLAFEGLDKNRFQNDDLGEILEDKIKRKQLFQKIQKEPKKPERKLMGLLRNGMKLAYTILGKNITNFDEKNLKVMSPKLFSVISEDGSDEDNDDDDPIDVLSPSLLSLHGNGKGFERELSLPNLIKGFTTADQQQWLDLIFEASGVEDTIKQAEDALIAQEFQVREKRSYEQRMQSPDGQPLYFTKEKAIETLGNPEAKRIEVSEALIKSYTKNQMKEMNETGYIVLSKKQLELVYGSNSPYANSKMIEHFSNLSAPEIHEQIEKEILNLKSYSYKDSKEINSNSTKNGHRLKRAIIASPIFGATVAFDPVLPSQPIILSPVLFTTVIGSPAIFGPIALSPWVFLPVILSPRTLSPPILSPLTFVPVVLSPLTLHPVILCPGIFNPVILSPLSLSPFILSPQVFTPIILSPMVMSPFILNPAVGGPVILSPFVLNPVIYSPLAYTALILSPNALSPVVKSPLFAAEIILSPSFLS